MKRTAFFISDGTGITAETLGNSLLTQFETVRFNTFTIPYVNTLEKAKDVVLQINVAQQKDGVKPIIFSTLVNVDIRAIIETSQGLFLDFFKTFIDPLEEELQVKPSRHIGRMHGLVDYKAYMARIAAVNYTLDHDDGMRPQNYDQAEVILIGVSRCGKTPTSLYLALQFGVFAANYPFTEEDMGEIKLPTSLEPYTHKLFGLSIEPHRLHLIRQERRPNSRYASLKQCELEVSKVENFFEQRKIPFLRTTTRSIEEIASSVVAIMKLNRRLTER